MNNVFTLTNINTKILQDKFSKIFISEVCTKLVALRINRFTRSILSHCRWPWLVHCVVLAKLGSSYGKTWCVGDFGWTSGLPRCL